MTNIFTKNTRPDTETLLKRVDELTSQIEQIDNLLIEKENELIKSSAMGEPTESILSEISKAEGLQRTLPLSIEALLQEIRENSKTEAVKECDILRKRLDKNILSMSKYREAILSAIEKYNSAVDGLDDELFGYRGSMKELLKSVQIILPDLDELTADINNQIDQKEGNLIDRVSATVAPQKSLKDLGIEISPKSSAGSYSPAPGSSVKDREQQDNLNKDKPGYYVPR